MDPVRRQLKLLDARTAERTAGVGGLFAYYPLLLPAAAFIAGIAAENTRTGGHWFPAAVGFLTVTTAAGSLILQDRKRLYSAAAAACLASFCLGAVRLKIYYQPPGDDVRSLVQHGRVLATVRGTVHTVPAADDAGLWKFGRYHWMEAGCRFYLRVNGVKGRDGWVEASGVILVQAPADAAYLRPGDCVEVQCWLDGFGEALNPGQFDLKESMRRRNVYVAAAVESTDAITPVEQTSRRAVATALVRLREKTSKALLDEILAEDEAAPMLAALLLGERTGIDIETADAFQRTGLAHFISLSGMHLGILSMTGWRLLRFTGLSRRRRAAVCVLLIALYVSIVPLRAPILRAAIICWVFFLSILFGRRAQPLNTLAIAVIAGLLIRPTDVFTAGWQLSYATVLGIILFQRPIANWMLEQTADRLYARVKASWAVRLMGALTWVVDLFAVGLAAWLGGSGVLLYHFGTIGPLASVWTVLVFPFVWGILVLGFAKILLTAVLPTAALALGLVLSLLSEGFAAAVRLLADVGFSEVRIGEVGGWFVAGYYALVLLLRFCRVARPLWRRVLFASAFGAILLPLAITKYTRTHRDDLEMTSLAVGHGQAVFIAFPGGRNVLLDTGSLSVRNCGWRTVVPFLRYKGVGRVHDLIISHDDIDHINGIPEVVSTIDVERIGSSAAVIAAAQTVSAAGYLRSCLAKCDREIELVAGNIETGGKATARVLWPTAQVCEDLTVSDNDKSLVLLVAFAGRRILLCSDIELYAQEQVFARYPDLRADVVVMPHHGSVSNLADGFVERLGVQTIIVNCSASRYGSAYRPPDGVRAFYTPVDGAVTVKIKAAGTLSVVGFTGRSDNSTAE